MAKGYVELEKHQLGMAQYLPKGLIGVTTSVDEQADMLMQRMTAFVLAEKVCDETITLDVRYPVDWWNHWKRDCAPKWFVKRWPVIYREEKQVVASHWAGYPELPEAIPNTGHIFRFTKWPSLNRIDI